MLQAGKTNNVTFKVNVMGTSSVPSVRAVLGTDPELSYKAQHVADDNWTVPITIPEDLEGTYSLRIEVVVNNRLFTPTSKSVTINRVPKLPETTPVEPASQLVTPTEAPVDLTPVAQESRPIAALLKDPTIVPPLPARQQAETIVRPAVPPTIVVKQQAAVPKQTQGLSLLKNFAEAPAKKCHKRIVTDLPKPGSVKVAVTPFTIAEVDALAPSPKIAETVASPKPTRSKSKIPVKLIKEHLFYE